MKRIGILGGLGPYATLSFQSLILKKALSYIQKMKGFQNATDQDFPDMTINMESTTPCRTNALLGKGASPLSRFQESLINLKNSGCDFAVIPCVTAHAWIQELRQDVPDIPVISMIEELVKNILKKPSVGKWLVLATVGTYHANLFQHAFSETNAISIVIPEIGHQNQIIDVIFNKTYGLKSGYGINDFAEFNLTKARQHPTKILLNIIKHYQDNHDITGVILGCTELPLATPPVFIKNELAIDAIDPMECLAEAAVDISYGYRDL